MSDSIISVENVSKRYLVGHQSGQSEGYNSLRDAIARELKNFARKANDLARGRQIVQGDEIEQFWALKDVSFKVGQGDVLGVVGNNGAGKSTLLKILSRITEPTKGRITLKGRVASLLEIGTGFHPELTGRENIYLNGAILGMSRNEIQRKFDEIVDFSQIGRFLDTPVKRYSSGMYVRLAFSVAAHLDHGILLVDEILAVGDAEFQKRSLGKLESIARNEGRTVIFVSHNTTALLALCQRGVLLESGSLASEGTIKEVVEQYYSRFDRMNATFAPKTDRPSITFVSVDRDSLQKGDLIVKIGFESPFPMDRVDAKFAINTRVGNPIYSSQFENGELLGDHPKCGTLRFALRHLPLATGHYTISVWLNAGLSNSDHQWNAISFAFQPEFRPPPPHVNAGPGYLNWPVEWHLLS